MQNNNSNIRVLEIASFYEQYLINFNSRHRHLRDCSFTSRINGFLRDGFAATHQPITYMQSCTGMFVIANDKIAQKAWAREHNIPFTEDWKFDIVREQIKIFKPDVLYALDCINYDGSFIKSLTNKPPLVAGWRAADVPFGTDWHDFDLILSGLPRMLPLAKELGAADAKLYYPGMPEWITKEVMNIPQDTDIVFVGSISPTQHNQRRMLIDAVAQTAIKHNFSLALHLTCDPSLVTPAMRPWLRPPVFGVEMHKALRRGRIVFDCQGDIGFIRPDGKRMVDLAAGDTANMRLFEATGTGSLLLTQAMPGLSRLFKVDEEIISFSSEKDLISKLCYYLTHEDERATVAQKGQKRCLTEWSMKRRAQVFKDIILEKLAQKKHI